MNTIKNQLAEEEADRRLQVGSAKACVHCDDTSTTVINEQPICSECEENLYDPAV